MMTKGTAAVHLFVAESLANFNFLAINFNNRHSFTSAPQAHSSLSMSTPFMLCSVQPTALRCDWLTQPSAGRARFAFIKPNWFFVTTIRCMATTIIIASLLDHILLWMANGLETSAWRSNFCTRDKTDAMWKLMQGNAFVSWYLCFCQKFRVAGDDDQRYFDWFESLWLSYIIHMIVICKYIQDPKCLWTMSRLNARLIGLSLQLSLRRMHQPIRLSLDSEVREKCMYFISAYRISASNHICG